VARHDVQPPLDPPLATATLVKAPSRLPPAPWTPESVALVKGCLDEVRSQGVHGDAAVATALNALISQAKAMGIDCSVTIGRLATGEVLASYQGDKFFNPASNTKLTTATFALKTLGPQFRFKTPLRRDSAGNLYLEGRFDPTIDHVALTELFKAVKGISGNIYLDNSRLPGSNTTPDGFSHFGGEDYDYLTPPSALAFDKDHDTFTITCDGEGRAVLQTPDDSRLAVRNEIQVVTQGHQYRVTMSVTKGDDGRPLIVLGGTYARGAHPKVLIIKTPDPVQEMSDAVLQVIRDQKIPFTGQVLPLPEGSSTPRDAKEIGSITSAPLEDILHQSLSRSIEFDMEMLAVAASSHLRGDVPVSVPGAVEDLNAFLKNDLGLSGFTLLNASGLGCVDLLSSGQFFKILTYAETHADVTPLLKDLALAGHTGTLQARMQGTLADGKLHAKTGTDGSAIALSGWVGPLAFSVLTSSPATERPKARMLVDALGILLAELSADSIWRTPTAASI
jgi:D-alanyl-D-alanine carboxypeptidase/D-alanyl-D-alanine-endopeptidase (penicillin-binding protein 4)